MAELVEMGSALDVGDQGIWVSFVRGMKTKAVREFKELCDEVRRLGKRIALPSFEAWRH